MAMTIVELQAFIDSKPDTRAIINEIADYLQVNPGGGGVTLYSGDGTLAGNREVDLNGKVLSFQQGVTGLLILDPTVDSENSRLLARNLTDDNNDGYIEFNALATQVSFEIAADFNGGVKRASIEAFADATTSSLTHTADNNIFSSAVAANFANDAAAAVGGIPVGGLYHTAGAAKIRLV